MPRHKINNLFRENMGVKLSENRSSGNKGYPANVRYGAPQHEAFSLPHSSHHGTNVQVEKPGLAEYYTQNVNSNQSSALVSNERSKMTSGDELKDAAQSIFDRVAKSLDGLSPHSSQTHFANANDYPSANQNAHHLPLDHHQQRHYLYQQHVQQQANLGYDSYVENIHQGYNNMPFSGYNDKHHVQHDIPIDHHLRNQQHQQHQQQQQNEGLHQARERRTRTSAPKVNSFLANTHKGQQHLEIQGESARLAPGSSGGRHHGEHADTDSTVISKPVQRPRRVSSATMRASKEEKQIRQQQATSLLDLDLEELGLPAGKRKSSTSRKTAQSARSRPQSKAAAASSTQSPRSARSTSRSSQKKKKQFPPKLSIQSARSQQKAEEKRAQERERKRSATARNKTKAKTNSRSTKSSSARVGITSSRSEGGSGREGVSRARSQMKHSTELREWLTANAKIKHRGTFLENDCKRGLSGLRARRTQSEGLSELVDLEREVMLREEKRKKEARVLTAEVNRIKRAAQRFKQQLKYVMAGPKHAQPPAQAKKRTPRSLISQSAVAAPSEGQGQKTEDPAAPPTIESLSEARLREETEELRRRMEAVEDGLLAFKTQRRVEYSEMQEEEEQLSEELSSLLIRFEKEDAQEKEDKRRKITPTLRRAQSKTGAGVGRKSSRGRKEFIHTPSPTPLQKSYHNSKSRDNTIGNGANAAFETPVPTVSGHALTSLTLSTPQTSRKSKTRSLSPSSPSLSPSQATQQEADELEEAALPSRFESEINVISGEVRRIDQWIAQHGGPSGGWSDDDHAHYLRLCSRTSSRRVLLQRMCSELMDVSVEAATRHAEWHTQYLDHTHRKKQLLQQWKKYKQKEEELRIEEQGKKDQQRRIEAARVRKERMAQEKKRNAELIRKWKEKKKMEEMADEALKKAKAFDAKRVAREKADKEKKRVQELMALYRQQQEEEELAKQAAEKVQAEEARVRARAQKAKEAELLEEQKHRLRTVAEKKAREKATKEREAQKEQARRKQSKTHIVVPRDPSRLTKATKIQLLRAKQKKEEEKAHSAGKGKQSLLGRVSGVSSLTVRPLYAPSRLASVSWRRGM